MIALCGAQETLRTHEREAASPLAAHEPAPGAGEQPVDQSV